MVIKEIIAETTDVLKRHNNENPVFEAHLIVRTILKLSPIDMLLKKSCEISDDDIDKIQLIVNRRLFGEPLQYILGTQEFMGLEFEVNPSVLIPRQDTEILVEYVLEHFAGKPISVLDLCSGSGCIAISVAHFNKNALVTGLDISSEAVKTAEQNAKALNVSDRVLFKKCDIFAMDFYGKFDLIVSNPPYIESEVIPTLSPTVKNFEPICALDGGADGLDFYNHIVNISPKYLNKGGMLAFEIGYNQKEAVSALMSASFSDITAKKDFGENYRVISGILK